MNQLSAQAQEQAEQATTFKPENLTWSAHRYQIGSRPMVEKLMTEISYIEHKLKLIDKQRMPNTIMRNNYIQMLKSREDVLDGLKQYKAQKGLKKIPSKRQFT